INRARQLERLRTAGEIGAPLEAEVTIYAPPEQAQRFSALGDELRFLLITSQARVVATGTPPADSVPSGERLDRGETEHPAQVCALLASAPGRRERPAASGTLCALRRQYRRAR